MTTAVSKTRLDIQALRGIAVGLVVLFHADLAGFQAGYLGVDVFFVISGYLIVGLIDVRLRSGQFSVKNFYLERARRLPPAAYVVYTLTLLGSLWLLTSSELQRFVNTLWSALTFSANLSLWSGTNYFSSSAKFNPLLHTWSLSLEEQFYFVLPFALLITPAKHRVAVVSFFGLSSLALCLVLLSRSPVATFYLLPTRAWEMALGGALALSQTSIARAFERFRDLNIAPTATTVLMGMPVMVILLVSLFAPGARIGLLHPSLDAILVCIACGLLLILPAKLLYQGNAAVCLGWLGNISYSLYLVHWPIFSLATNVFIGEKIPVGVRITLVIVSTILALLIYRFVEVPFRILSVATHRRRIIGMLGGSSAFMIILILSTTRSGIGSSSAVGMKVANFGLSEKCEFATRLEPIAACRTTDAPRTLLWGDSFAMHLAVGLANHAPGGFLQATKSGCGPIVGLAPAFPTVPFPKQWSLDCLAFNQSVIDYIAVHPDIRRVVLSSVWKQYVEAEGKALLLRRATEGPVDAEVSRHAAANLVATIRYIQSLGREVVLVSPTPATGMDIGICHERRMAGLITLGVVNDCKLPANQSQDFRAPPMRLLTEVSQVTGARLVNLAKYLCDGDYCRTEIDGVPLYSDAGHFSAEGSKKLMTATGVAVDIMVER